MPTTLTTDRITCQPLSESHRGLYVVLHSDPELMRNVAAPLSPEQADRAFERTLKDCAAGRRRYWAASDQASTTFAIAGLIMRTSSSADIGCLLTSSHQSKGLGTELIGMVMRYGFVELGLDQLTSSSYRSAVPSFFLMRQLGFGFGACETMADESGPGLSWHLTREQWFAQQQKERLTS